MNPPVFTTLRRQQFRRYFQPSRVLLGVVPAPSQSGVNIITLCFSMYCSYKPPMMAIAVHNRSATYNLIQATDEFVLSVPGEAMVREAMYCGSKSMNEVDKVRALNIELVDSTTVLVPGLASAIANIEMLKTNTTLAGDHILIVGRVNRFAVNVKNDEKPLVSLGPNTTGYKLLLNKGIHRLGTVGTT